MRPTTLARRCATLLAVPVLAAGLVACGGSEEDPGDDPSASSDAPGATDSPGAVDPTASAYLSVGPGVELTEPGTTLRFGEPAVIAWQPRQDSTAALRVTVDRVDRTSFKESFQGWIITDDMEGQTPVFVRLSVANAGEANVGGEPVPIAVIDDEGVRIQPTTAAEKEFVPCPGGALPKKFGPGAKTDLCLLYLLAPGASFDSVGFLPVDSDAQPVGEAITWEGRLTPIDDDKGDDKGKGGKGGDDTGGDRG